MNDYVIKTNCGLPNKKFNFLIRGISGKNWYDVGSIDENGYKDYCSMELIFIWLIFIKKININTLDNFTIQQCIEKYKNENENSNLQLLDTIIDIGAHQGHFALSFSTMAKNVISIEPCKENYEILLENIKLNKVKNINTIHSFVSSETTTKKFTENHKNLFNNESFSEEICECMILDSLKNKISENTLIKIDTEGEEIEVLKGAKNILKEKTPSLIIELHDFCKTDHNEIKDIIDFELYEIVKISRGDNIIRKYQQNENLKNINWLFLRKKEQKNQEIKQFISNKLPKVFCLTLKNTPKRKEYAQRHFNQHGLDVEFFEGINGAEFGLRTTIPYKDDNLDGPDYFIKQGKIGCLLSHYMLWKTLWHLPHEEILILEDDAFLCDNFQEKFLQFKKRLPDDWQYVFIGHCCLMPPEHQTIIADGIVIPSHPPMCTHGYMIKKSTIPTLIETNSQAWSAVDIQIQKKSLKLLKYYVCNPPLVNQISIAQGLNIEDQKIFSSLTVDSLYE